MIIYAISKVEISKITMANTKGWTCWYYNGRFINIYIQNYSFKKKTYQRIFL